MNYVQKFKRLYLLSLAESFKIFGAAVLSWLIFWLLNYLIKSFDLPVLNELLEFFYFIFLIILIIWGLRPILKVFSLQGFGPSLWMFLFLIFNFCFAALITLFLIFIFGQINLWEVLKGSFHVDIYLG